MTIPRKRKPRCPCGKPRAYYGPIGGYSVACVECNAKNAARQRAVRAGRASVLAISVWILALFGCGRAPDSYVITDGRTEGTEIRYESLSFEDLDGYNCQMEVTLTNLRPVACRIGWASEVYFKDGSEGYGFVFDSFAAGETCYEMYGNIGRRTDSGRDYPPCSEVEWIAPLYSWQECDDGFSGESGDREEYYELTAQGPGDHGDYSDHAESY